ncbi:MAG: G5 domain-containing protein [Clostridiales bacterium]|nr:G5 domain-containing protein [Clostridiales bacterium]
MARVAVITLVLIGIIGFFLWLILHKNAYMVYVDEKEVGAVRMAKIITEEYLSSSASERLKEQNGIDVIINERLSIKPARVSGSKLLSMDKLASAIDSEVSIRVRASALKVNGTVLAVMKSAVEIEMVKDKVIKLYSDNMPNLVSASFVEDVQSEDIFVSKSEIMTIDAVFEILSAAKKTEDVYTVQPADSLSIIAERCQMSLDDLLSKNPDISISSPLSIGQVLTIEKRTLPVSIRTVEETKRVETAPAPLEVIKNPSMDSSYQNLIQEGVDGKQEVTVHTTKINGFFESSTTVSTAEIEKPIPRIEEIGSAE